MTASSLERSYRRLLCPGAADTLNLFGGAARVRLRRLMTGAPDPGWRDALALTSLIAPVVLVALVLRQNLGWIGGLAGVAALAILAVLAARRSRADVAS